MKVHYPDFPAVGRFEANYFLPEAWKPEYRNPAFANARPDDRFWAARIIAALPDDAVRGDRADRTVRRIRVRREYLIDTLLARKSKVLTAWLNGTNPIVNPALSAIGRADVRERGGTRPASSAAAERYTVEWSRFDNATGTHEPAGAETTVTEPRAQAPRVTAGVKA